MMQKFWEGRSTLFEAPRQGVAMTAIPNAMTAIANAGAEPAKTADQRDDPRTSMFVGNQARDAERVATDARDAERVGTDVSQDARQGMGDLRKEYSAIPDVQTYNRVIQQVDTALHTPPTAAGDQALLYSIAQMRDPLGSVDKDDAALIEGGVPFVQQQIQRLKTKLGSDGLFPAAYRDALRKEATARLNTANRAYSSLRHQYAEVARAAGYDPKLVVGPHAGAPYVERFRDYDKRNQIGEYSPEAIARKAAADYRPDIDELTTNFEDTGVETSDITGGRFQPKNEAAWAAYLQARAGDPSFNREEALRFLKSLGEPGSLDLTPEFIDAVRKGEPFSTGIDYSQSDAALKQAALERSYEVIPEGGDTSKFGLDKGISLNLSDELMGVSGGIYDTLTGGSFAQGYERERDTERALQQRSRESAGLLPEFIGGALVPGGILTKGNLVRDGFAMGAIAGFGEGEGLGDSLSKATTGGVVSAVAGKGIEVAAPYVAPVVDKIASGAQRLLPKSAASREFVEAADRLDLGYMAADIPGATVSRKVTQVSKMTLGGIPVADRARKLMDAALEHKDQIARAIGPRVDQQGAGQAVQRGMARWDASSADDVSRMVDAIPIAPKAVAVTDNTKAALGEINAGLESNRALSAEIADPVMTRYQAALESGGLSWADIKKFRSYIESQVGKSTTTSKGDLDKLLAGLTSDMKATALREGPKAARAFRRADTAARDRATRREEVLTSLLGTGYDKGDRAAFDQIQFWANKDTGDWTKLSRAMRSLPKKDADLVRATSVDRLGMAPKPDGGEAFTPSAFVTQWNGMDPRARAILFPGEHGKALDDLAIYFDGIKNATQDLAKLSTLDVITAATSTATAFSADVMTGAMASIGLLGAGKLLSSKTFASWLAALSRKPNPAAILQHIERLTALARSEPVLANDIFTLQQRLSEQFTRSPPSSAAGDSGDRRSVPPARGSRSVAPAQGERRNAP